MRLAKPTTASPFELDVFGLDLEKLTTFRFAVQVDGHSTQDALCGFQRVVNVGEAVDVREVLEGGYPGRHKFPRHSKHGAIQLVKGMTTSRHLWNWHQAVVSWDKGEPDYRRTMSIFMLDEHNVGGALFPYEVWHWQVFDAWPSEWRGPRLDAMRAEFAVESVIIQHSGISEAKGLFSGTAGDILSLFS